jgi:hypothetical protein
MKNNRIYQNQHQTADKIINSIELGHRRIHVVAPTQSGKTGVIVSLANKMKDNNFILTSGMMDNHLYDQNSNIAETSAPNIIAIKINKLLEEPNPKSIIKRLDIKVIVVDENNYGIGKKSRIDKFIKKLLSMDLSVKIIWLGATGYQLVNSELIDDTIQMNVPYNYFGCNQILKLPNLKDSKDFKFTIDADSELRKKVGIDYGFSLSSDFLNELDYLKSFETGMGIIRVSKIEMAKNLKVAIGHARPFSETLVATSAGTDSIKDVVTEAKMLSNTKRVVLIVVGGLKAGVDLGQAKNNIRFIIETYKTKAAVSQGLVGRISGYHENRDISIIADKSAIELQAAYENDYRCINDEFLKKMFDGGTHRLATNFSFRQKSKDPKNESRDKTYYGNNYKVTNTDEVKAEWFTGYNEDYFHKVKDLMVKIRKNKDSKDGYRVSTKDFPSKNDRINTIQGNKFKKENIKTRNQYFDRVKPSVIDFNIFHRFAKWRIGEDGGKYLTNSAKYIKVGILYNNKKDFFNIVVRHKETVDIKTTRINNKSIFNNKNDKDE